MRTAVCAVVKNEETIIAEWIAYHLAVGFDTILIFDNNSTDGTNDLIHRARLVGDVRLVSWPKSTPDFQGKCYEVGNLILSGDCDWVLFIDCDEFFVPQADLKVNKFLSRFSDDVGAIGVHELFFGSSNIIESPSDLIIRSFTKRANDDFGPNFQVKSFVRPNRNPTYENPHCFSIDGLYLSAGGDNIEWERKGVAKKIYAPDIAHINHYFTRSKEDWDNKLARGYLDGTIRSESDFDLYDRNEVDDRVTFKHLQKTINILKSIYSFDEGQYVIDNPQLSSMSKTNLFDHFIRHRQELGRSFYQKSGPVERPSLGKMMMKRFGL